MANMAGADLTVRLAGLPPPQKEPDTEEVCRGSSPILCVCVCMPLCCIFWLNTLLPRSVQAQR